MNTLEALAVRKAIKVWRDRWTEQIAKDLDASIPELRSLLFAEIDDMKRIDTFRTKRLTSEKLQPLFVDWCQKKEHALLTAAENDLQNQFKRTVAYRRANNKINVDVSKAFLLDLAGAALSSVAAAATIPAIVALSTTAVSAGGFLGLLGFTTTVLVTKNIVIGLIVLAILMTVSQWRFSKSISNAKTRLREQIEQQIQERVIYSKKEPSLAILLTDRIEDTARQLLSEIDHAA